MVNTLAHLLGTSLGGVIALVWLFGLLLYVFLPIMAFSVTRNVRRMRVALERIADASESPSADKRTGMLGL